MAKYGMSKHPLYGTWNNMMNRCYNWKLPQFKDWGGRGIKVVPRWHNVRLFIEDIEAMIGPRPPGMTLDRIDNDSDYAPGKVRWATRAEQIRNSRVFTDGLRTDSLYRVWWRLMRRCPDQVCPDWHDLAAFRFDVIRLIGPRPDGLRFDRINDAVPYGPGNIIWITGTEQVRRAQAAKLAEPYPVKHGLWQHPLYATWNRITSEYPEKVHESWLDTVTFIRDVEQLIGPRPDGAVFRRIDPDGTFAPGNVHWGPRGRPPRKH